MDGPIETAVERAEELIEKQYPDHEPIAAVIVVAVRNEEGYTGISWAGSRGLDLMHIMGLLRAGVIVSDETLRLGVSLPNIDSGND